MGYEVNKGVIYSLAFGHVHLAHYTMDHNVKSIVLFLMDICPRNKSIKRRYLYIFKIGQYTTIRSCIRSEIRLISSS